MFKIQVIDSNALIAENIATYLRGQGYEVRACSDGYEGWESLEEFHPDLLITEITLPGMDGFELIKRVGESYPEIRVLVMSSRNIINAFEYLKVARSYGIEFSLLKPFRDDYLRLIVQKLLDIEDNQQFMSEPLRSA